MQGKIFDIRLSYIPLFSLVVRDFPDKIHFIVDFIFGSAFYRVGIFHIGVLSLETVGIDAIIRLTDSWWYREIVTCDHAMPDHILGDTMPDRSCAANSRDVLHRRSITVTDPHTDDCISAV